MVEEQKTIMAQYGQGLNSEVISKMDQLHRVMKEVLRLHPPLIMLLRYVHEDFT